MTALAQRTVDLSRAVCHIDQRESAHRVGPSLTADTCVTSDSENEQCVGWECTRGVVARGRGAASSIFFDRGDASPTPPLFWTETRAQVSPLLQLVTY